MMRISICNEVIAEFSFARQCAFARSVGYDGIEITPMTLSAEPHVLPRAQRVEVRRAAADAGIAITGLHYLLRAPAGLSITTADASRRARTIDVMWRLCDLAADLGAGVLVHGSPEQRQLEPGKETDGRKRAVECLAAVAAAAEAARVTYCVEPLARDLTGCINTVEEAATIVRQIGSPAIRTMIDCSSAARTEAESIPDLLARWLPTGLIGHMHFNDPNRRGPGEGALTFAPILAALRTYDRDAAIEPFVYEPDGPTCAARQIGYIGGLREALGL
jgi:D-psicose/D-tagatose/L-ribulose 3-epimerase